jgi:hypothetical protein
MIKTIGSTGRYLHAHSGGGTNYVNNYNGAQGVGNLRFNTASQSMEIWDGTVWIQMVTSHAMVGLDADAIELLDWAKAKRQEELRIKELAKQHPGIQDLQQKLDIMIALVNQDQHE